jgi:hypothetical protein
VDSPAAARAFALRHRLPRPLSRAYEAALLAPTEAEAAQRVRWAAAVAVRFLGALAQAGRRAGYPAEPVNPPGEADLKRLPPALVPPELSDLNPGPLLRLAGLAPGAAAGQPLSALESALGVVAFLARCRLVVPEGDSLRVLLGPRVEYLVGGSIAAELARAVGEGIPALVDAAAGRWLSLASLAVWTRDPRSAFGRLYGLRRREGNWGRFVEEGSPGSPSVLRTLAGPSTAGALPADAMFRRDIVSPPARWRDGDALEDRYEVLGLIWRGGTSDVFVARRRANAQLVVLKTHEGEPGRLDENYLRFANEERFSRRAAHAGVIASRRAELTAGATTHEQALAEKGSLADILLANSVLSAAQSAGIAAELLDALAAVHAGGVAHNDVKPDNILFDAEGRLRLIDFGIAAELAPERGALRAGAPAGSRGYMAPELAAGAFPSAASDLFSAGVVLGEMLSGERLAAPAAAKACRALPAAFRPWLARCLDADPGRRFAGAEEAAAALRAIPSAPGRHLALDIEGTIIDSFDSRRPRPGLADFLAFCLACFDRLFVYTMLRRAEAAKVFAELVAAGIAPETFLHCYEYVDWDRASEGPYKDLRRCRVPLAEIALVDDSPAVVSEDQAHRWIQVPEFQDAVRGDRALAIARSELEQLFSLLDGR